MITISTIFCTANVCRDLQGLCGEIRVRGFQIYGDCMYTRNPCNFWSKSKKVWTFYKYILLRFFKFPYNFCGNFRRTCNPRDNHMHFTGYVLRQWDPPHFLWGKNLQCTSGFSGLYYKNFGNIRDMGYFQKPHTLKVGGGKGKGLSIIEKRCIFKDDFARIIYCRQYLLALFKVPTN